MAKWMNIAIRESGMRSKQQMAFLFADASNVKKYYALDVLCVHLTGFLATVADAQVLQAAKANLQHVQGTRKASRGSR